MEKLMKWLLTEQGRSGFLMMIYHNLKQLKILEEISTIAQFSNILGRVWQNFPASLD